MPGLHDNCAKWILAGNAFCAVMEARFSHPPICRAKCRGIRRSGGVHSLAQGVYTFHPLNSTSKQHSSSFCSIVGRPEARRCPKISFRRKPYLHKNAAIRQILTPQAENTPIFAPFSLGSAKMPRSVRPGCISGASPKPRPLFCQSRRICRAARQRAFYNCDN